MFKIKPFFINNEVTKEDCDKKESIKLKCQINFISSFGIHLLLIIQCILLIGPTESI